ncbi:MAG: tRNA pseudouridine(38-40) synthase TruA [Lachnospiraceae bacterium]|nr:tRNA pseudouridine(38-40) synthase TruA [Lachnospiraceae bacterium]
MANYRFEIQYEGTRYAGWQRLSGKENTIQGKIEDVLGRLTGEPVAVIGAGRTDAGVHARGQAANAHFATNLSDLDIREYMNQYLPEDIRICLVEQVSEDFHSRYQAKEKCYLYRVSLKEVPDVFSRRYVYEYAKDTQRSLEERREAAAGALDVEAMKKAAAYLLGEHDFRGFCGRKIKKKSTVRCIHSIDIRMEEGELRFYYKGNGFLFHMIRIMTGTLLEVGEGKRPAEDMKYILETKDRQNAGRTLPAKGLTLLSVDF